RTPEPNSVIWPDAGRSSPRSTFRSVVFPDPFGPMMPRKSPRPMRRLTSSSTRSLPWSKLTCSSSTTGSPLVTVEPVGKMIEVFMHHRKIVPALTQLFARQSFEWIECQDPRAHFACQRLGHLRAYQGLIIHDLDMMRSGQMHKLTQPGGRWLGLRRQPTDGQLHEPVAACQVSERRMGSDEFLLTTASQPRSKLVVKGEQLSPQGQGARLEHLAALCVSLLESPGDIGHHPSRELRVEPHVRVEACRRLTLGATLLLVDRLSQGQSIAGV